MGFMCANSGDAKPNPFPTGQQLAQVLQAFGIIDAAAVDDPEGYDNYATLEAVNAAAKALRESPDLPAPSLPQP